MPDSQVDIEIRAKALLGDAQQAIQQFLNEVDTGARKATQSGNDFSSAMKTAAGSLAGFVSAQAIMSGVRTAFDFAKQAVFGMNATLETSTLQFTTLMGDSDKAAAHVRDLFEIAKKTPFETGPIIEASRMLQTFGGSALNTKDNIMLLGDAAAATGAPINELGFWVGRMYSMIKGGQPFGEAAMRLQELAVLTPEARRQMEGLQKSGADADKVFGVFTESLGKFGGAMEKQAGTWAGVTSTFSDTINILLADTFKPFFEAVRDGMAVVNTALSGPEMDKALNAFKDGIQQSFAGKTTNESIRGFVAMIFQAASVAVTTADIIYRGFAGLKMVFAGTASVVDLVAEGFVNLSLVVAKVAASIPGVNKLIGQDTVNSLSLTAAALKTSQKDFHEMAASALNAVEGNSQFSKTLGALRTGLGDVSTALQKTVDIGVVMGDGMPRAAAKVADSFKPVSKEAGNLGKNFKELAVNVAEGMKRLGDEDFLKEFGSKLEDARRDAEKFGVALPAAIQAGLDRAGKITVDKLVAINENDMHEKARKLSDAFNKQYEKDQRESLNRLQAQLKDAASDFIDMEASANEIRNKQFMTDYEYQVSVVESEEAKKLEVLDRTKAGWELRMQGIKDVAAAKMAELRQKHDEELLAMRGSENGWASSFKTVLADIPNLLKSALTGGGGMAGFGKAIAADIGQNIGGDLVTKGLNGLVNHFSTNLTNTFGSNFVAGFAGMIPGLGGMIGSLAGPLISKLGDGLKKLFGGPSKSELGAREEAAKFQQTMVDLFEKTASAQARAEAGGERWRMVNIAVRDAYLAVGKTGEEAMADLEALNNATHISADAVRAAEARINDTLKEQQEIQDALKQKQDLLNEAVSRYGFTIEELGPAMRNQKLSEQAEELIQDYGILAGSGIDVDTVIKRMSGSINDFIHLAMKTGTEVPEAMKPMLQKMVEQGLLTDANGVKITDLKNSGITFGETLTQGFKHVVDKLDELIGRLANMKSGIDNIPDHKTSTIDIVERRTVQTKYEDENDRNSETTVTGSAGGGIYTKPTFRVIAEQKPEVVGEPNMIAQSFMQALEKSGGAGAVGDSSKLEAQVGRVLDGVRQVMNAIQDLPDGMGRAVRDAVLLAR